MTSLECPSYWRRSSSGSLFRLSISVELVSNTSRTLQSSPSRLHIDFFQREYGQLFCRLALDAEFLAASEVAQAVLPADKACYLRTPTPTADGNDITRSFRCCASNYFRQHAVS